MGGRDFIGQHAHLASQIYADTDFEQPAYSGSGGVSVTDGVTTVAASSILAPALSIVDAGSGVAKLRVARLWGPYTIDFNDPKGVVKDFDDLPTPCFVARCWAIPKQDWSQTDAFLTIGVDLTNGSAPGFYGSVTYDAFNFTPWADSKLMAREDLPGSAGGVQSGPQAIYLAEGATAKLAASHDGGVGDPTTGKAIVWAEVMDAS